MKCPRCESENVETTTIGWMPPAPNPNWANCLACGHQGSAGDWTLVADLRRDAERWRAIEPYLDLTAGKIGKATCVSMSHIFHFDGDLTVEQCVDRLVEEARKRP